MKRNATGIALQMILNEIRYWPEDGEIWACMKRSKL